MLIFKSVVFHFNMENVLNFDSMPENVQMIYNPHGDDLVIPAFYLGQCGQQGQLLPPLCKCCKEKKKTATRQELGVGKKGKPGKTGSQEGLPGGAQRLLGPVVVHAAANCFNTVPGSAGGGGGKASTWLQSPPLTAWVGACSAQGMHSV